MQGGSDADLRHRPANSQQQSPRSRHSSQRNTKHGPDTQRSSDHHHKHHHHHHLPDQKYPFSADDDNDDDSQQPGEQH